MLIQKGKKNMNNSKFIKRALSAFLATAMIFSMAGCKAGNKGDNVKTNEAKQIVNYFTSSEFTTPENMGNIDQIYGLNDKVYIWGMSEGADNCQRKASIFDMTEKKSKEVDFSSLNISYVDKVYYEGNTLYISYSDEDYNQKFAAFDLESNSITNEISFPQDEYPMEIKKDNDGSILVSKGKWGMKSAESYLEKYDAVTLERKSSENLNKKLNLENNETVGYIESAADGSYYFMSVVYDFTSESEDMKIKLRKTTAELDEVFCVDDFSDMEGYPAFITTLKNGNISLATTEDYSNFFFNEIDSLTGEVVNRYECSLDSEFVTIVENLNYEDADMVVLTSDGMYKLSVESGKTEKVLEFGTDIPSEFKDSRMVSYSDNNLFIYNEVWGESSQIISIFDTDGNEINSFSFVPENGGYISVMDVSKDGKIYMVNEVNTYDESDEDGGHKMTYAIKVYSEEGELENTFSIDNIDGIDDLGDSYVGLIKVAENGNIYLGISTYSYDKEGSSYIVELDSEGKVTKTISDERINYIQNLINTESDGDYIIYSNKDYVTEISKIDLVNGTVGEAADLDLPYDYDILPGDGNYDFCLSTSEGIYGYSIKDNKTTEIINWVDSDILARVRSVAFCGKDRMICNMYDYETGESSVKVLNRADEETLKKIQNKKIITVAGMDISYYNGLQSSIVDFNKTNDEYRIQVNDYSKFSEYEDDTYKSGAFKLNNDIASGNIPDIIIGNTEVDMTSFAAKGILADLNPMIDNDKEISREDYFENIFDIFSYKGKLNQLVTNFSVLTLAGSTQTLGKESGWTYDEFFANADKGSVFYEMPKTELADLFIKRNMSEFVDFENKTCDFDNENFIRLLEFINEDGIDEEDEDSITPRYEDMDKESEIIRRFADKKCSLEVLNLFDFRTLLELQQGAVNGEVALKGFPSNEGNGALIAADSTFGICEKSKNKDAAWSFIREFILEDYQNSLNEDYASTFPVLKSAYDKIEKRAMSDEYSGYTVETPDGEAVEMTPLDKQTADKVRDLISNADSAMVSDERITAIVDEEIEAFIAGSKTAAEVAGTIQNKVSTYLKEIK